MISSSRLLPLRTTTWLCRVRLPLQTFNNRSDSQPPPQHQIFIHQSPGWHLSQLDTRWYSRWSFVKQTVKNNKEHTTTHDNIIPANLKHSETFLKNTFSFGHISSPNECGDMRSGIWMDYFLHTYLLLTLCRNRKQSNFLLRPRLGNEKLIQQYVPSLFLSVWARSKAEACNPTSDSSGWFQ